ncbi:MAG: hypothetical protein ABI898_02015 [Sphingomonadales bacterium]
MIETREDQLLAEMLALAEQLKASDDELLVGQYAYLHARISALIELRSMAGMTAES